MSKYLVIIFLSGILFAACGDETKVNDSLGEQRAQTQGQSQNSLQGNSNNVIHRTDPRGFCLEMSGQMMQQALQTPDAAAKLQKEGIGIGSCPNSFQGFGIAIRCDPTNFSMEGGGQIPTVVTLYSNLISDPSEGAEMCQRVNASLSQGG